MFVAQQQSLVVGSIDAGRCCGLGRASAKLVKHVVAQEVEFCHMSD